MPVENPQDAAPSPARDQLAVLSRGWNNAAERAFSGVLDRPDLYQRTARLVGAVAAALRTEAAGSDAGTRAHGLLAAWERRAELLETVVADDDLLTLAGLDRDVTAGAAFALRYRELLVELAADDRLQALRDAERSGSPDQGWVVVEEAGYRPGDPFVPYRRLEVDVATGRALQVTTQPDDDFSGCVHRVDVVALDLATGRLQSPEDDPEAPWTSREVASEEERESWVEDLKRRFRSAPPQVTGG